MKRITYSWFRLVCLVSLTYLVGCGAPNATPKRNPEKSNSRENQSLNVVYVCDVREMSADKIRTVRKLVASSTVVADGEVYLRVSIHQLEKWPRSARLLDFDLTGTGLGGFVDCMKDGKQYSIEKHAFAVGRMPYGSLQRIKDDLKGFCVDLGVEDPQVNTAGLLEYGQKILYMNARLPVPHINANETVKIEVSLKNIGGETLRFQRVERFTAQFTVGNTCLNYPPRVPLLEFLKSARHIPISVLDPGEMWTTELIIHPKEVPDGEYPMVIYYEIPCTATEEDALTGTFRTETMMVRVQRTDGLRSRSDRNSQPSAGGDGEPAPQP